MELDEVKKLNIFERVALITAEIGSVTKDLKVGEGRSPTRRPVKEVFCRR